MSVGKMKMVTITGNIEKLDEASVACLACDCFQPEDSSKYLSSGLQKLEKLNQENPYTKYLNSIKNYLAAFEIVPKLIETSETAFNREECETFIAAAEERLAEAKKEKNCLQEEMVLCNSSKGQLSHFSGMEVNLRDIFDCQFITARFGRLPAENFQALDSYHDNPNILFIPFSNDNDYYWGMYVTPTKAADAVDRIFAGLFFEQLPIPDLTTTPSKAIEELTNRQTTAENRIKEIDLSLKNYFQDQEEKLILLYSQLTKLSNAFEIRKNAVRSVNRFMLIGWIPILEEDRFKEIFLNVKGVELTFLIKTD